MKIVHMLISLAGLGLLLFEAPAGNLLTNTPERGQVQRQTGPTTVRGGGPMFLWFGGYHGGK